MTRATITRKLRIYDPSELPAWLQGKAVHEWVEVPNSRIDQAADWNNYTPVKGYMGNPGLFADSGATVKTAGSEFIIIGGGHADYAGNEVFSLRLADDAPVWVRRIDPTPNNLIPWDHYGTLAPKAYYDDGRPAARHTYWNLQFCNERNWAMLFGCSAIYSGAANNFPTVDAFDFTTNTYFPEGTFPLQGMQVEGGGIVTAADGDVYLFYPSGNIGKWTQSANSFSALPARGVYNVETGFAYDSKRNRVLRMQRFQGGAVAPAIYDLNNNAAMTSISMPGYLPDGNGRGSVIYCPAADAFFAMNWGQAPLWKIDPVTFAATVVTTTGSAPPMNYDPGSDGFGRFYGRFNYAPELRAIVFALRPSHPVRVMRTV